MTVHGSSSVDTTAPFYDPTMLLVEDQCDDASGNGNYFLAYDATSETYVIFDLGCVVYVTEIKLKNSKSAHWNK